MADSFLTCLLHFITDIKYCLSRKLHDAGYDIRVDVKAKDVPVTLTYKAGIAQDTGVWRGKDRLIISS